MSGRSGVSVVISATDRATAQINAINKRLAAMQAPVERLQKSLSKFADLSGITRLAHGVESLRNSAVGAFQALGQMVGPLSAITGAASIAGMAALVSRWGEFGQRLGNAAARANVTASQLYTLQGSARLAGAGAEDLTQGLTTLGDTMTNALGGRAPQAYAYLKQLGVRFEAVGGGVRSAADVMPELADALNRIGNPTLRARVGTELLGGAYEKLAPWLRRGSAGMAELDAIVKRYGVTTDAGVKAAQELEMAHQRLSLSVDGLTNSIAERLAPVLTPLLVQMAEWIAKNREWIAQGISDHVQEFATWLQSIDWTAVGDGVTGFYHGVEDVVNAVGGWKEALLLVLAIKFAPMIAALVSIGVEVGKLTIAFGTTLVAAITKAETAMVGFNTKTMALPVFRVLAVLYGIYDASKGGIEINPKNIGPDSPFFKDLSPPDQEESKRLHPPLASGSGLQQFWNWMRGGGGGGAGGPAATGGSPGPTSTTSSTDLSVQERALLDALSGGEASSAGYDSKNPHGSAYGRYQFIDKTRFSLLKQMGLSPDTPLTPALQDQMAIRLARQAGWRPDMSPEESAATLRGIWPSLPGGSQENTSASTWAQRLRNATAAESARAPAASVNNGSGAPAPSVDLKGGANLKIQVSAPQGTQASASTYGNIFGGAPKIEHSSVGFAATG